MPDVDNIDKIEVGKTMKSCAKKHSLIKFEDITCPLCDLLKSTASEMRNKNNEIDALASQIESLKFEKKEIDGEMENMSKQVAQLKTDLDLTRNGQRDGEQ
jgi:predicted  nucleic acid-binding Zn-ribbon protein